MGQLPKCACLTSAALRSSARSGRRTTLAIAIEGFVGSHTEYRWTLESAHAPRGGREGNPALPVGQWESAQ
jgi:hypothetical protein